MQLDLLLFIEYLSVIEFIEYIWVKLEDVFILM